ncbi:MAG: glyoxylase-like metal-dependent hydrolase (beta-lactamase superfamily II) [Kiritimatiellia bacterium]|jgi:glyoxylase-like metal-dependent hydrolase (beta-lactamase superfamily II)
MNIQHFFHAATWTHTYVVYDPHTRDAVIIDPVLDFDTAAWSVSTETIEMVCEWITQTGLTVHMCLETHVHADHMSASQYVNRHLGCDVVIGAGVTKVLETFRHVLSLGNEVPTDGSGFDILANDGATLDAGSLHIDIIATPGHTPACTTYRIQDAIFTGDVLFMPDQGTGRCDFPGGSAQDQFDSIHKLYKLPPNTRVFVGHDYGPGGREIAHESTIQDEMQSNVQLPADRSRDNFIAFRTARDAGLNPPKLLLQSLQVNCRAGRMPSAAPNGHTYLLMPLTIADSI